MVNKNTICIEYTDKYPVKEITILFAFCVTQQLFKANKSSKQPNMCPSGTTQKRSLILTHSSTSTSTQGRNYPVSERYAATILAPPPQKTKKNKSVLDIITYGL